MRLERRGQRPTTPPGRQADRGHHLLALLHRSRGRRRSRRWSKDFEAANPGVHVTVKCGQDDEKMRQAIAAGKGPDVGLSYSTDIVGKFCTTGAWRRPRPVDRAGQGRPRCAAPDRPQLHGVRRQALRDADAGRRVRALLQQGPAAGGRLRRAAEDLERARGDGGEAHDQEVRRLDRRRRLRPAPRLLREHQRAPRAQLRRDLAHRRREVQRRHRPGVEGHAGVAEVAGRHDRRRRSCSGSTPAWARSSRRTTRSRRGRSR